MSNVKALMVMSKEKPSLSLSQKDLPAIKNWKVGGKYNISLSVEEVSMSKDDYEPGMNARFKINKAKECNCG